MPRLVAEQSASAGRAENAASATATKKASRFRPAATNHSPNFIGKYSSLPWDNVLDGSAQKRVTLLIRFLVTRPRHPELHSLDRARLFSQSTEPSAQYGNV